MVISENVVHIFNHNQKWSFNIEYCSVYKVKVNNFENSGQIIINHLSAFSYQTAVVRKAPPFLLQARCCMFRKLTCITTCSPSLVQEIILYFPIYSALLLYVCVCGCAGRYCNCVLGVGEGVHEVMC